MLATPAGLTVVSLLHGARLLLPLPFPVLLAVGTVVPVALAHQRHPHAHVQGPVAWETGMVAMIITAWWLSQEEATEPGKWKGPPRSHTGHPKNPTATSLNANFSGSLPFPDLSFFPSLFYSSFT